MQWPGSGAVMDWPTSGLFTWLHIRGRRDKLDYKGIDMPYIPQDDRYRFQFALGELHDTTMQKGLSNGDLNYLITQLGALYLKRHGKSYNTISDVIKAFECAKLEFYARVARPYEDKKIEQNGDVF